MSGPAAAPCLCVAAVRPHRACSRQAHKPITTTHHKSLRHAPKKRSTNRRLLVLIPFRIAKGQPDTETHALLVLPFLGLYLSSSVHRASIKLEFRERHMGTETTLWERAL